MQTKKRFVMGAVCWAVAMMAGSLSPAVGAVGPEVILCVAALVGGTGVARDHRAAAERLEL